MGRRIYLEVRNDGGVVLRWVKKVLENKYILNLAHPLGWHLENGAASVAPRVWKGLH